MDNKPFAVELRSNSSQWKHMGSHADYNGAWNQITGEKGIFYDDYCKRDDIRITFQCARCHNTVMCSKEPGGIGYGIFKGAVHCYQCSAEINKELMIETGKTVLYLEKKDGHYTITDWTGRLSFNVRCTSIGCNSFSGYRKGTRVDAWFIGPDGKPWWGVHQGLHNTTIRCRRIQRFPD